jgi:hypothetical protein
VLYSEVRNIHDDGRAPAVMFYETKVDVYVHRCLIINQISTAKAIELRDAKIRNATLIDIHASDIIGLRVTTAIKY